MALLMSMLIGITSNIDNIGIGLSYGLRKARIPWSFCCVTALTSFTACLLGSFTGARITHFISTSTCSIIGSMILICIGLWTIIQVFVSKADQVQLETKTTIGFSEMMFIALAQGMTDLSIGFGAGFAQLNTLELSVSVGLFSFILLLIPARLGGRLIPNRLGKSATFLSGILLILVGLYL